MKNKFLKQTLLITVMLSSNLATAALLGASGPNLFGYQGNDIGYNFRDISLIGNEVLNGQDDASVLVNLGFNFDFYGNTYSGVNVTSNGVMSFSSTSHFCCTPTVGITPGTDINFAWSDWDLSEGGSAYTLTSGVIGSREFVFGYYGIGHNSNFDNIDPIFSTLEVILHEGSNNIEFQYNNLFQHSDQRTSDNIKIGIQNNTTDSLDVAYFEAVGPSRLVLSNQGYLISNNIDVPEPSSLAILSLGLMGLASRRFKKS